ncbi:OmpA family protein [Priestia megaterium]|uniref:OmpA family protein n=1 Tax=Priestia megaterium TaxID=1404 RepID=A0A6H1P5B7_PRIMG|nr:OmpA family protein [Priestia megaterium]QIZ08471.1 OmpA family protein [Priestia megaterium]
MARGLRNANRHASSGHEDEKEGFWVSYTDLMSGLVIIFALVLMVAIFDMQNAYNETKVAVEQKNEAIKKQQKMIEDVVGVKSKLIAELVKEFKTSKLKPEIDRQTGAIRFSGGVFFDENSTEITKKGREYLEEFIPQYTKILLSDQFKGEIAQIIVEGHTNTKGGYLYNLNLSQGRALSVVTEIYSPTFRKFNNKELLKNVITANGRSYSMPIYDSKGKIDAEKSRRVEFKFRLKDDEVLDKIQKLVNEDE